MIRADGLEKRYGEFVAVGGSDFSADAGEIFGIVGPNGAGKTTTLKMLAGLVEPTAGEATVAGYDVDDPEMRRALGFLPEESPLYENMTARTYLSFFADLYDVPGDIADQRIESTLDRLDLEHRDRRLGDVSKGMKRKVAIARSLVNDPDVLVYDEPASGLDPLTTHEVLQFVQELADDGKTVVFSAHNLYHVADLCDRVIVMNEGSIIARGGVEEIREAHGRTTYRVYATVELPESEPAGDRYLVEVESLDAADAVRERVREAGGEVIDVRTDEPSLEDVFLELTGEHSAHRRRERAADSREREGSR
ncbi:ABC transporter ATP-binding protein [Halolamina sp. C58]|uniref:ABC transporter ATP-binding protein n=1 Tax=Halolamina sp. C58 TaxID=3421640 RepID=UPI003EC005C4